MDQLVRYHDKCRETSKLARELGKVDVAEWIDLRIEEGEAQQAAKNKVTIYQNGNHNISFKIFFRATHQNQSRFRLPYQ